MVLYKGGEISCCGSHCLLHCAFLISASSIKGCGGKWYQSCNKFCQVWIFYNFKIKGEPHIRNRILLYLLDCLDLSRLQPHNKKPVVAYKRGLTVTSWRLQLTQTIHIQNNSKTPTSRMITLLSSLHTLNRSPPYHVTNIWYVKPLVNAIILWYNPTQQFFDISVFSTWFGLRKFGRLGLGSRKYSSGKD